MASEYKIGDIVQLMSGGPAMTISSDGDPDGNYHCVWFKGAARETARFKGSTLKKYEPPKKA